MKITLNADDYFDYFGTSEIKKDVLHHLSLEKFEVTLYGVSYRIKTLFKENLLPDILKLKLSNKNSDAYILSPMKFTFFYDETNKNSRIIHVAFINESNFIDERSFKCTHFTIEFDENTLEFLSGEDLMNYRRESLLKLHDLMKKKDSLRRR